MKTDQQKENLLTGSLTNLLSEYKLERLNEEILLGYFVEFMEGAGLDSRITVKVLEKFGETGKQEALAIKINEGW